MIEFFQGAPWHQLTDFLAAGDPPMITRILIVNTIFFVLFAYRRARGVPSMREKTAIRVQVLLLAANALVLFQHEIENYIDYIGRLI